MRRIHPLNMLYEHRRGRESKQLKPFSAANTLMWSEVHDKMFDGAEIANFLRISVHITIFEGLSRQQAKHSKSDIS